MADSNQGMLQELQTIRTVVNQLQLQHDNQSTASHSKAYEDSQTQNSTIQDHISIFSIVYFEGAIRQTCDVYCPCQYHQKSTSQTPTWLKPVMGSLFLQYQTIPFLSRAECDSKNCKVRSRSSPRVWYMFPAWMVSCLVDISTSWGSITGFRASLHIRVPLLSTWAI